jgi:hypothetical protein
MSSPPAAKEELSKTHKPTPPLVSLISGGVAGGVEGFLTYRTSNSGPKLLLLDRVLWSSGNIQGNHMLIGFFVGQPSNSPKPVPNWDVSQVPSKPHTKYPKTPS